MKLRIGVLAAVVAVVSGCQEAARCSVQSDCPAMAQCIEGYCVEGAPADSGAGGADGGDAGSGDDAGTDDAGTDGGTEDGGVVPGPCDEVMCPRGYECRERASDAGVCELAFSALELVSPDGGTYGPDASVAVVARLVRKPGFTMASGPTLASIFVDAMDAGVPMLSGDEYALQLGTAGLSHGSHVVAVTATFADAGLSAGGGFEVDAMGPELSFVRPGSPDYKRDDIVMVAVEATEPVSSVSLSVGGAAMSPTACDGGVQCGAGKSCRCFDMDLSQPELKALTANFGVVMQATDLYGNAATGDGGTVAVSRVRWVTQVAGGAMRTAPAVGPDGTVYVGTGVEPGFTLGVLQAIDPLTGADAGATAAWGAINAIAVSPPQTQVNGAGTVTGSVVYAVANGVVGGGDQNAKGRLLGRSAQLTSQVSGVSLPSPAEANGTNKVWSGLALTKTTNNQVAAISTSESSATSPGRILKWGSVSGGNTVDLDQTPVTFLGSALEPSVVPTQSPVAVSPVIRDAATAPIAAFVTTQPLVGAHPAEGLFTRYVSNLVTGTPTLLNDQPRLHTSRLTRSAGLVPLSSTTVLVGSTGAQQSLYRVSPSAVDLSFAPASNVDFGLPAYANATRGFVGVDGALIRFSPLTLTGGEQLAVFSGTNAFTSPVLLEPRIGRPAEGYTVTRSGQFVRFDASAGGTASDSWTAPIPSSTGPLEVVTHPGFDCNRRPGAATGTTGILYVAALDGRLFSIIVDSPRLLSDTGSWPKYQRTMGNAGNDDTMFFPTNWTNCPAN